LLSNNRPRGVPAAIRTTAAITNEQYEAMETKVRLTALEHQYIIGEVDRVEIAKHAAEAKLAAAEAKQVVSGQFPTTSKKYTPTRTPSVQRVFVVFLIFYVGRLLYRGYRGSHDYCLGTTGGPYMDSECRPFMFKKEDILWLVVGLLAIGVAATAEFALFVAVIFSVNT
jgi:hypothetical protein